MGRHGAPQARQRVHGADARDLLGSPQREGRTPLWLARQGAGGPLADHRGRGASLHPVHDRHPRGDRRDPARTGRVPAGDPRAGPKVPARAGGHRPELPGQARHGHARASRAGMGGVSGLHRRGQGGVRAADERPGSAQPFRRALPPAPRRRDQRLGGRVAGHAGPREPREAVAEDRAPGTGHRGARLRAARAVGRLSGVRAPPRSLDRREDAAACGGSVRGRRAGPPGTGSAARAVAGPGRPVEASDHRAHVRQGTGRRPAGGRHRGVRRRGRVRGRDHAGLVPPDRRPRPPRLRHQGRASSRRGRPARCHLGGSGHGPAPGPGAGAGGPVPGGG